MSATTNFRFQHFSPSDTHTSMSISPITYASSVRSPYQLEDVSLSPQKESLRVQVLEKTLRKDSKYQFGAEVAESPNPAYYNNDTSSETRKPLLRAMTSLQLKKKSCVKDKNTDCDEISEENPVLSDRSRKAPLTSPNVKTMKFVRQQSFNGSFFQTDASQNTALNKSTESEILVESQAKKMTDSVLRASVLGSPFRESWRVKKEEK